MNQSIITLALAAVTVVKVLVDLVRMGYSDLPRWASPLLAVLFGLAAAFLVVASNGTIITGPIASQCVLAGILAGGAAVDPRPGVPRRPGRRRRLRGKEPDAEAAGGGGVPGVELELSSWPSRGR